MRFIVITIMSLTIATSALANPPLRDVKPINDGLLYVGLADEIRKNCKSISGRLFRGVGRLRAIHKSAVDMGYSKSEIETFVESRAEKNRLKALGQSYLKANGASLNKPDTMCALGRKEIAMKSAIGTLLYEN
ncbi:DUF5333 domain-containing protein [Amylibacter sp.]|nr:DUF5333 domain-containing protein [Amylibacter sp.]